MPETEKIRVCVNTWQTCSVVLEHRKIKSDVCSQLRSDVSRQSNAFMSRRCSSCFSLLEVSLPPGSSRSGITDVFSCFLLFCWRLSAGLSRGGGKDSSPIRRGSILSAGTAFSLCSLSLWPHYSFNSTKWHHLTAANNTKHYFFLR